jgi:TonB family protein
VSAFRDLAKAMAQVPAPAAARLPDAAPQGPPGGVTPAFDRNTVYTIADTDVVPPVVLAQRIPRWTPTRGDAMQEFRGTLQVLVDERGMVTAATLKASVHQTYDAELVKAVRGWKFSPAQKQGVPVRYLKMFDIRLTPATTSGR